MSVSFSLLLLSWFFTKLSIPQGVRDVDSRPPYLRGRENQYDGLVPRTPMNMETAVTVVGKFAVAEAKAQGRPTTRSPTPPTPSEEEIKRHLNTPPRDKSLFWSGPPEGPPYQEPATELAHANGFKVLGDLWKDDDPLYPDRFSKKPGFWKDASAAMAQKTSGVANVVLPEDSEPHPASVWTTTERPALEENNDVTEIVKWTLEGGQGEVIHRAGALTLFFSVFSPQFFSLTWMAVLIRKVFQTQAIQSLRHRQYRPLRSTSPPLNIRSPKEAKCLSTLSTRINPGSVFNLRSQPILRRLGRRKFPFQRRPVPLMTSLGGNGRRGRLRRGRGLSIIRR